MQASFLTFGLDVQQQERASGAALVEVDLCNKQFADPSLAVMDTREAVADTTSHPNIERLL